MSDESNTKKKSEDKKAISNVVRLAVKRRLKKKPVKASFSKKSFFFPALLDTIPIPIYYKNTEGVYLGCNKAMEEVLGMSKEKFIGKKVGDLAPTEFAKAHEESDAEILKKLKPQTYEAKVLAKDGTLRSVMFSKSVYYGMDGKVAGIVGAMVDMTEYRANEKKLKQGEDFLKCLINTIPAPIFYKDTNGVYIGGNKAFFDFVGIKRETLIGKTVYDVAPKELGDKYKAMDDELFENGGIQRYEFNVKHADGMKRDVIFNKGVFYGEDGKAAGLIGCMTDITQHVRDEKEYADREELFRSLVETTNCIVWEVDLKTLNFTYVSPQASAITGYSPSEWKNFESWAAMIHPDDRKKAVEFCQLQTSKGIDHQFEYRVVRKDRKVIWIRDIANIVRKNNEVTGLRGFLIDITGIKRAEEEAVAVRNMLKTVLDAIPARVFWKDKNLKYIGCNAAFARDSGMNEPDALTGKDDFQMGWKNEAELYRADDRRIMALGEPKLNYEEPQTGPKGEKLWIRTSKTPLRGPSGEIIGVLGTYEDITGIKKAEEELKKAKVIADSANKAKSAFLAAMSHEIRTPLTVITGIAELLGESKLDAEQQRKVTMLKTAGDTLINIVNEILDFSRVESGHVEMYVSPFNLSELVDTIVEMMTLKTAEKGVAFTYSIDKEVPRALVGAGLRLREVLMNLIANAIRCTEGGGRVGLSVSLDTSVIHSDKETSLLFKVEDTGIGIPEDKKAFIFSPFVSSDQMRGGMRQGTGLGLAISRRLVELMGGRIWFESEEGKGTVFNFIVPFDLQKGAQREVVTEVRQAPVRKAAANRTYKVLLVEDSGHIREMVKFFLNEGPYEVRAVGDGLSGVLEFKEGNYDIVIMDIQMPGISGYEATSRIREHEKEKGLRPVPIITLSAHALKEHEQMSLDAGATRHVTKPVKKQELLTAMQACLEESDAVGAAEFVLKVKKSDIEEAKRFLASMLEKVNGLLALPKDDSVAGAAGLLEMWHGFILGREGFLTLKEFTAQLKKEADAANGKAVIDALGRIQVYLKAVRVVPE
ncbi:MAG: PAS domain S-box protein [Deltaproteobacteria bacterium]|nr:PAS domain S-box protein [Deltaproteobacteria bacterium]